MGAYWAVLAGAIVCAMWALLRALALLGAEPRAESLEPSRAWAQRAPKVIVVERVCLPAAHAEPWPEGAPVEDVWTVRPTRAGGRPLPAPGGLDRLA